MPQLRAQVHQQLIGGPACLFKGPGLHNGAYPDIQLHEIVKRGLFHMSASCYQSLSSFRTAMKASVGTCTVPRFRIFFLPSFCFSSSFFLRVMSPP